MCWKEMWWKIKWKEMSFSFTIFTVHDEKVNEKSNEKKCDEKLNEKKCVFPFLQFSLDMIKNYNFHRTWWKIK